MTTARTTLGVLKAARTLLSDPAKWTQGTIARATNGKPTVSYFYGGQSAPPVCWCAIGALSNVAPSGAEDAELAAERALEETLRLIGFDTRPDEEGLAAVAAYNDSHSHAQVLDLFDRTIARLESEAA